MPAACTIIAVGREASATGAPMITHSDDMGASTTDVRLVRVPRKTWPKGSVRPFYRWQIPYPRVVSSFLGASDYAPVGDQQEAVSLGHIPQVRETWAYWDTDYGVQNEWGLSIGESTATANTVGWPAVPDLPYGYNLVGIEDLSKIALERCKTARCAVETMGAIAVKHGFYSGDSGSPDKPVHGGSSEVLVLADADPGDVWIFNVLTGEGNRSAIWAAQRVPPNHVVAVGNSFTIRSLNLSSPEDNLYSPGVKHLAEKMGWWTKSEESSPEVFDFFSAYGYQPKPGVNTWEPRSEDTILSFYSGRRMWRIFSLLSADEGALLDPNLGNLPKTPNPYPPSVPAPRGSVTLPMVMNAMRDHYEGTPYDLTKGMASGPWGNPNRARTAKGVVGQWERAIAMYRSGWSFVLEARSQQLSRLWWGYDSAHSTVYLPFYGAATGPAPKSFCNSELRMSVFSVDAAYWAFSIVNQYSDRNFKVINGDIRKEAFKAEEQALSQILTWEAEALHLVGDNGDIQQALQSLTDKSNEFAERKVAAWWDYAWHLIAKYGREIVTYNESEVGGTAPALWVLPEWWLRSPEVGFSSWTPQGPFHGINLTENQTAAALQCLNNSAQVLSSSELAAGASTLQPSQNCNISSVSLGVFAFATPGHSVSSLVMTTTFGMAIAAVSYFLGVKHGRREHGHGQVRDVYTLHIC